MRNKNLSAKFLLLLVVAAIAFSSCSKKTCPAYSQLNPTEVSTKA